MSHPGVHNNPIRALIEGKNYALPGGGQRRVLGPIDLCLEPGTFTCLLGPSGCGKSTLLNIVGGLDRDFEGEVTGRSDSRLGFVFQEPRLLPWLTVRENVELVLEDSSRPVEEFLDAVGLGGAADLHANRLSTGMARRVALARAFAVRPKLLLMDEPFVSLDSECAQAMRHLLKQIIEQFPVTVLFVTHDKKEAEELGDRILELGGSPTRIVKQSQGRGSSKAGDAL